MSLHFNSVEKILAQLETQPGWEKLREHRQLLQSWEQVVNQQTAQHTRPLYINRQILYIATSSSARAQELSFQRHTLLKRLNQQLTTKIQDLHFSSSQWHQQNPEQDTQALFTISDRHQTKISPDLLVIPKENERVKDNHLSPQDRAKNAAQRWLKTIEHRSKVTLACPKCNSLISQAELSRWNLCHHCVAQKWSEEYCSPVFQNQE
jgi:predicted nucleic acid-binding Zn ribbon protein